MTALGVALKEWAVICAALAEGRQALLLRKGGIAEAAGEFRVEHAHFWLYPTYVHQQRAGVTPDGLPLLERALAAKPPEGVVRLSHFAEVAGAYRLRELGDAERLAGLHLWSDETVRARFAYRAPGLHALAVRVHRLPAPWEVPESPEYAGCRSWVELGRELPTGGAAPVLDDGAFAALLGEVEGRLGPAGPGKD